MDHTCKLIRVEHGDAGVFGVLLVDGQTYCFTLEPQDCIPEGTYACQLRDSARFGRKLYGVMDVPGRTDIEIHMGNTVSDTHGCVLLGGKCWDQPRGIGESLAMLNAFMLKLAGADFTLEVVELVV